MLNILQACAGELARLSRLFLLHKQNGSGKTTLRHCLGRAGWSLVLLAIGPVRQKMLSGGLLARPWPPPIVLAKSAAPVAATAGLRVGVLVLVSMPPAE